MTAPSPSPQNPAVELSKSERTRRAILACAIDHFGQDGFRTTSVSDISRSAGVSGSLAYAYFKNKEDLFVAAVNHDAAAVIQEGSASLLNSRIEGPPGISSFDSLLDAMDRHPLAKRILAGQEPFATHLLLKLDAIDDATDGAAALLLEARDSGVIRSDVDPVVAGKASVHLWIMAMMAAAQFGRSKATAEFREVQAIFYKGIFVESPLPEPDDPAPGEDNQL